MAGFGCGKRDFDRVLVTHLANEDDFGCLAQCGTERRGKTGRVAVQFALVYGPKFVDVQELDGIFDRYDVIGARGVNKVNDCGECRRFSRTCGACHKDNAIFKLGNLLQFGGKIELIETRNVVRNNAHNNSQTAALFKNVDAETSLLGQGIRRSAEPSSLRLRAACWLVPMRS